MHVEVDRAPAEAGKAGLEGGRQVVRPGAHAGRKLGRDLELAVAGQLAEAAFGGATGVHRSGVEQRRAGRQAGLQRGPLVLDVGWPAIGELGRAEPSEP